VAIVHILSRIRRYQHRPEHGSVLVAVLVAALLLVSPAPAVEPVSDAGEEGAGIAVPLTVSHAALAREFGALLGVDRGGWVRLQHDACNWSALSGVAFSAIDAERLQLRLDARAQVAGAAFGGCIGPGEWAGHIRVELLPRVLDTGLAIGFEVGTVELLRPDGRSSLLGRAGRFVFDVAILPRLEHFRVDIEAPLLALEHLTAGLLPSGPGALPDRPTLGRLDVDAVGLVSELRLPVPEASAVLSLPEAPLDAAEVAAWSALEDEFDGFLTTVILAIGTDLADAELRQEILSVLLDARHAIAEALTDDDPDRVRDEPDPVRELFISTWDALRPHLMHIAALPGQPIDDLRMAAFIAGGDAILAIDALGPGYGIDISRDGLRRLARLLLGEQAPASFTPLPLGVDPRFRQLLPFAPRRPLLLSQSRWSQLHPLRVAHANPSQLLFELNEALRGRVAQVSEIDEYLGLVSQLLAAETAFRTSGEGRFPAEHEALVAPLLRATAWKESCWRQFTGAPDAPRVLTSSAGALGMMQINARVWRGIYDVERLTDDVAYNVRAGGDILEYYFVDHALRRREHEQPGGSENLVKAAYAAYNGGPRHLSRYRTDGGSSRLRAIDREFWRHYTLMRDNGGWPDVASCFAIPR
jgi:hypothetical protein